MGNRGFPYRFIFPCVYILFSLVDLLLFQLEDNLEEVSHGNHHLPGGLLSLDPKETVTILWTAVDVTKCTVVRHVLGNKADLVHRVVVQAILQPDIQYFVAIWITHTGLDIIKLNREHISHPCLLVPYLEAVNSNLNIDLAAASRNKNDWNPTFCLCSPDALIAIFSSWSASCKLSLTRMEWRSNNPQKIWWKLSLKDRALFRCDSISLHLPLSVSQSVSGSLIVSDLEILHLRALRAC